MMTTNRHCTVRLDRRKYARLVAIAHTKGCTPSDLLRASVDLLLASRDLASSSDRRLARISEFQHLALDVIIREQYPELRDRIVAETDRRLEQYHGA